MRCLKTFIFVSLGLSVIELPGMVYLCFIPIAVLWYTVFALLGGFSAVLLVLFVELFQRRRAPSGAYIATLTASIMLVCGIWVGLFAPALQHDAQKAEREHKYLAQGTNFDKDFFWSIGLGLSSFALVAFMAKPRKT